MKIIVNGEPQILEAPLNVQQMLTQNGYGDMMIAVARNGTFVPKGTYDEVMLEEADQIDIVAPMQGG